MPVAAAENSQHLRAALRQLHTVQRAKVNSTGFSSPVLSVQQVPHMRGSGKEEKDQM